MRSEILLPIYATENDPAIRMTTTDLFFVLCKYVSLTVEKKEGLPHLKKFKSFRQSQAFFLVIKFDFQKKDLTLFYPNYCVNA